MYQFVEEVETFKAPADDDFRSENDHVSVYANEKVRSSYISEREYRRQNLRIHDEEKVGVVPFSVISFSTLESCNPIPVQNTNKCKHIRVRAVTHSPSPVLSCIENAPQGAYISRVNEADSDRQSYNDIEASKVLQDVHISARLTEDFLELAKDNTKKDLETCGVLGAFLERGIFYVTTLIIPKQESSSNSCHALHEEEVFAIQNEQSLFPVGWIHTHPSQSCFMSSIDLHTQYSYQVMVPEAFAIVVAPTDTSRSYGLFRLTDPSGMSVLRECQETCGFHPHKETSDGRPIYEQCTHVYTNSNLRFEIFDLR